MSSRLMLPVLVLAAALPAADLSAASPSCDGPNEHLLSWPAGEPVWEFCWLRPGDSSGDDGSGLEIRNAYYNGIQVFKRAHVPMLNVDYDPNGCGCFRDWLSNEKFYGTENEVTPGYFEPPWPAETVCDFATSPTVPPGDCPWTGGNATACDEGVSAEFYADRVVLTTQANAGWYRYLMRWHFYENGTIEPRFGFGTYNTTCAGDSHRHHAYWRFDFDIDGADKDTVSQVNGSPSGQIAQEADRSWESGDVHWEIHDSGSGRGYSLTPSVQDLKLAVDGFSKTDFMVTLFHPGEYTDIGGGCDVDVEDLVNGETVLDTDVVVYYRSGVHDQFGIDIHVCKVGGPTLVPLGDWGGQPGPDIFADGFESGDTTAWSLTVD